VTSRLISPVLERIPVPSTATLRRFTFVAALTQALIAVTGAVVRVTGSGLGCPTWPQCFPGSLVPVGGADVPAWQQAIEFGNRMLTYVVVLAAVAAVVAVLRAGRRAELRRYAWALPLGTVVQAVLGGVTVLTGLQWWTVAPHFLVSMVLVWLAVQLHVGVSRPDDARVAAIVPAALRGLLALSTVVLGALLAAGTLVTAAGPHSGSADVDRLSAVSIPSLVQLHGDLLVGYLALLIGLVVGLRAAGSPRTLQRKAWLVVVVVVAQGAVGLAQYLTGVPQVLVTLHVAGAAAVTAATAALWAHTRAPGPALRPPRPPTTRAPPPAERGPRQDDVSGRAHRPSAAGWPGSG
jgi:cytochrome c oxidase assembly protein subunit 15